MKKFKVLTVVGTRPEIIRLSSIIKSLDKKINHVLVHTGQNYDYELSKIFFKDLSLRYPDYQIESDNDNPINKISIILNEVEKIISKEKPDAFVILGDTNSCLSAYCAKRLKVPIFHIEAGNRCYDQRVPEEINRKIIDHISDINITYSNVAKNNLLRENLNPDRIFQIGSPLAEVYKKNKKKIFKSKILNQLGIKKNNYLLISVHREENLDNKRNFKKFINLLVFLNKTRKEKIVVSTHPRTKKILENFDIKDLKKIIFHKPFSYSDYSFLQLNAKSVLSDSGSITEESSIMGFDAINLRPTNERQEGMEYGIVPMSHFDLDIITGLIDIKNSKKNQVKDYNCLNFSDIFFNILLSYTEYVNEYTWKKNN